MQAYKCDLCLKYCDSVYSVDLPYFLPKKEGKCRIAEMCESCKIKLGVWIYENYKQESEVSNER